MKKIVLRQAQHNPEQNRRIAILEPGAWGLTLGILLSKKNEVRFWYENPAISLKIAKFRKNDRLPGIKIPRDIFISSELREVIKRANLIIIASSSEKAVKNLTALAF